MMSLHYVRCVYHGMDTLVFVFLWWACGAVWWVVARRMRFGFGVQVPEAPATGSCLGLGQRLVCWFVVFVRSGE